MKIDGKVYCFFEQSGTFKNEFIKLGIPAEDYDIQNEFGQTDHIIDLFAEIENAYDGRPSVFDSITPDDLVVAFFPCVYFCATSQMSFFWSCVNYRSKSMKQKTDMILERSKNRERFYSLAVKMLAVSDMRGLRCIMENPYAEQTYLKSNFVAPPTLVDMDRTRRGDIYTEPTAYWFINCKPTHGRSFQRPKEHKIIMNAKRGRSAIAPAYARNFICDFILGKENENTLRDLFNDGNE